MSDREGGGSVHGRRWQLCECEDHRWRSWHHKSMEQRHLHDSPLATSFLHHYLVQQVLQEWQMDQRMDQGSAAQVE